MVMRFIWSQNIINARDNIIHELLLGTADAEFNFDTFVFDMVDQYGVREDDVFKFFKTKSEYIFMN